MNERNIQVSIVIVCMNNLNNLYLCLNSIKKYSRIDYETFVVAYLFSEENLEQVKSDFPWVNFIESNEIRGFSENNNIALKQTKGKYCLVLNDDTELVDPLIDKLVDTIEKLPQSVGIVSPVLYLSDGSVQFCGRPPIPLSKHVMSVFKLWNEGREISKYTNQCGIFKSYNITGACFLIKRDLFEKVGWFDERFFFTPEDIALSTKLNKMGYECYVNADLKIIHFEGKTRKSSMSYASVKPASMRGNLIYYADGSRLRYAFLVGIHLISMPALIAYHFLLGYNKEKPNIHYAMMVGYINSVKACFSKKSAKEIFKKYYEKYK